MNACQIQHVKFELARHYDDDWEDHLLDYWYALADEELARLGVPSRGNGLARSIVTTGFADVAKALGHVSFDDRTALKAIAKGMKVLEDRWDAELMATYSPSLKQLTKQLGNEADPAGARRRGDNRNPRRRPR